MTEHELRKEICRVGSSLFDRGYVHATAGNISARLTGGYLITPTDACLGLSLSGVWSKDDIVPPITPYYVMKVGHVPLVPYHRPGDPAVGDIVAHTIEMMRAKRTPIRAVMIDRLGPNVWHTSLTAAMATLEELEETARLWQICTPRPTPLSPDQINELRVHFGAFW